MRILPLLLVAAGSAAAAHAHAATEVRIGTTASAKNQVTGLLGANRRTLKLGDGVFQNESLATGQGASAQILFMDETALTMGPNSRVVLDRVVYDPAGRKGELAIRATSGAFRFISGSGPKQGYKIATPMGTIGVRGTIIEFLIRGQWLTLSLTEGGTFICISPQNCVELDKPGTYVVSNGTQLGSEKSKYDKACGEGNGTTKCLVGEGDDSLYVLFIGIPRFLNELSPATGPNPGNHPPPPTGAGFPPIQTGAGSVPQGLQKPTLPPGLANRGPSFLPHGQQKK